MDTSQDILVIILSAALAILLVLAIIVAVLVIKILQAVRRISDKAEHVIETAEHVGEAFSNATGSMALFKIIRNIASMAAKYSSANKHKE